MRMTFVHLKYEEKSWDLYGIELNGNYATAELSSLIKGHDIVSFAKAQRIG
jgi:hypothetical protein